MQTPQIVLTFTHLRALHDVLQETFLKVTNNEMWTALPQRTSFFIGAHWFQITVTCVRQRIVGRDGKKVKKGREGEGVR